MPELEEGKLTAKDAVERMLAGNECKTIIDFFTKYVRLNRDVKVDSSLQVDMLIYDVIVPKKGLKQFSRGLVAACETNSIKYKKESYERFVIRLGDGPGKLKSIIVIIS